MDWATGNQGESKGTTGNQGETRELPVTRVWARGLPVTRVQLMEYLVLWGAQESTMSH